MMKTLATLVLAVGLLGAAPTLAMAHPHHGGGFSVGFGFGGCDGGYVGYSDGCYGSTVYYGGSCCTPCGHWECQTETYVVTCGYWNQVWVGDCCCGHYENVWVPPVYGTRTVRVWVP